MNSILNIELVANRKHPKYQQLADAIIEGIHKGEFVINDKLPSVKQLKETLKINAETVFNAYHLLREKGFIESDERRGYFVTNTNVETEYRVFLLFDKLTPFKQVLYNSIVKNFSEKASIDIFFHHHNYDVFRNLVLNNIDKYSHFAIVTFVDGDIKEVLQQIPSHKLMLLDNDEPSLNLDYASVHQDFYQDIFCGLEKGLSKIKKYTDLHLIVAPHFIHISEREKGFFDFCKQYKFNAFTGNRINSKKIKKGSLFIIQADKDLSDLLKVCKKENLRIGKDIGIITYNQSPLMEFVEGGISVMSSDFEEMGKQAAKMILHNKREKIKNPFHLVIRGSL